MVYILLLFATMSHSWAEANPVAFEQTAWQVAMPAQRAVVVTEVIEGMLEGRLTPLQDLEWSPGFTDLVEAWNNSPPLPDSDGRMAQVALVAAQAHGKGMSVNAWGALWKLLTRDLLPVEIAKRDRKQIDDLIVEQFAAVHSQWDPEVLMPFAEQMGPGNKAKVRNLYWPLTNSGPWVHNADLRTLMVAIWFVPAYSPSDDEIVAMLDQQGRDQDVYYLGLDRRSVYDSSHVVFERQLTLLLQDQLRPKPAARTAGEILNGMESSTAARVAGAVLAWHESFEGARPKEYNEQGLLAALLKPWMTNRYHGTPPHDVAPLKTYASRLGVLLTRCRAWEADHPGVSRDSDARPEALEKRLAELIGAETGGR